MERRHRHRLDGEARGRRRTDLRRSRRHPGHALLGRHVRGRPRRAEPPHHALAALDPGAGRARRHAAVQPARRQCPGSGRQAVPGDAGRRRGAPQRGVAALPRATARRRDLCAGRQREGDLRHAARHLVVASQDDRPAARRRDLRRFAVPHAGGVVQGSGAAPGLPAHPAGRGAPHGLCHAVAARDREPGNRGRASRDGGLRRVGAQPHAGRHLPARCLPGHGLRQGRARRDQAVPARARGGRR